MPAARGFTEGTRIQLCGRLSVELGGSQVEEQLRGRQVPLLLAYLVLNRFRHVGREELIDALWPYRPPRSEDAALRTLLSRLRSALGSEALAGRDGLILTLPEPVWIDVEAAGVEAQRAQETLARGDARSAWALSQVPLNIASRGLLPGAQVSWLEPWRRDLEEIRLQALEVVGQSGLALGGTQLASVERAARGLIDAEPYRESGYVLLMESLTRRGNAAEALRVFDRLRTLLREELGTAPSPDVIAAHERLLRPESREIPDGDTTRAHLSASIDLPAELRAHAEAPLVGRKRELAALSGHWNRAIGESGAEHEIHEEPMPGPGFARIVVLVGDPGIGKTRLTAALAERAHGSGAVVLAGRAPEEMLVPYQPFLEALRHYVVNAPLAELRANAREYGPELARLVPELRRRAPDLAPPLAVEPETERYRLFEAVVGLMSAVSNSRPILLVLDDLHWADRPTLLLLRHLARAVNPARLLILGAYRATETPIDGFSDALADLRRERLLTQLDVDGLSEGETAELVRIRAGEAPSLQFTRALHQETEGNPFFIEEIVRHLGDAGVHVGSAGARELQRFGLPEGVKQVIARRLTRLDPPAVEWLRTAAVIGRDFDASLLERVLALDEAEFLGALDEALAAGLVVESETAPGRYSFSHALVHETLYEGMSGSRRARLHRRVGDALEEWGGPVAALARHFTLAGSQAHAEKAITYAWRAGDEASSMLAHEEAAEHYARALEVMRRFDSGSADRRCELLLLLGEARVRGGERALAVPALREAAELAEILGDGERIARAAISASDRYVQQPGVVQSELIAMLGRALELTTDRTLLRVRLLARLCGALYYSAERGRMRELSEEATDIAQELGDPEARAYGCAARRRALWDPAHLHERLQTSTEMLKFARETANLELSLQAHAWLAVDLLEHGDREAVDAQIEAFSAGAQQLREPLYLWNAIVWRAMLALLAGRLELSEALAAEALAAGAPGEAVTAPQYYAIQLLATRREQRRMGELERPTRELVEDNPRRPAWRAALADLLMETGQMTEARAQFELLAARDFEDLPPDGDWMTAITLLSDVCVGLGDSRRAELLYRQLLPYARANVVIGLAAVCLGSAARFLGNLAATAGRGEDAVGHFERALRANAELNAPVCLAHTQLDYARLLGRGTRAAELAQTAGSVAAELGLPWVAHRAAEIQPQ